MSRTSLLRLGDDAAGDARRGGAAGAARNRVNDDGGAAIAEDRMFIRAESHIRGGGAGMGRAVCGHNQGEVWDVAGRETLMRVPRSIEMGTGGLLRMPLY